MPLPLPLPSFADEPGLLMLVSSAKRAANYSWMETVPSVSVIVDPGKATGLGLKLCRGQLCLNVNSTTKDELLELHIGGDTRDDERCPRRMDRHGTILYDVAEYDVVHVTPSG